MFRISVENFVLNFLSVWEKIKFLSWYVFFSRTLYIHVFGIKGHRYFVHNFNEFENISIIFGTDNSDTLNKWQITKRTITTSPALPSDASDECCSGWQQMSLHSLVDERVCGEYHKTRLIWMTKHWQSGSLWHCVTQHCVTLSFVNTKVWNLSFTPNYELTPN